MRRTGAGVRPDTATPAGEPGPDVEIRRVRTQAEYDECVRIQDEIWGAEFNERVPSTIFRVSQYLGGVTAAAFQPDAGQRMLGFVFGLTGVQDGSLVHWSDLLAVRPEARDRGLGRRLKLYQRSLVAPLGVTRMLWTFDPLVAKNAHLNLNALGARVTEYVADMYGADTGSSLHSAVGTDRAIVSWDLTREAPDRRGRAGGSGAMVPVVNPAGPSGVPAIGALPDGPTIYIQVPGDIHELIASAPAAAWQWRETTRTAFRHYLEEGYEVAGFSRSPADGTGFYRLTRR